MIRSVVLGIFLSLYFSGYTQDPIKITMIPRSANCLAISLPIPRLAPVTNAVRCSIRELNLLLTQRQIPFSSLHFRADQRYL